MDDYTSDPELKRTVKISILESSIGQAHLSLAMQNSIFLTKFAVMLGASPLQFGILAAIGQVSQVFQLLGAAISRKLTTRKPGVVRLALAARLLAPVYAALPFVVSDAIGMWAFLFLYLVSTSLFAVSANMWVAWISDMVPIGIRGRFFSRRSQYGLVVGLVVGYIAGGFIDLFDSRSSSFVSDLFVGLRSVEFFSPEHLPYGFAAIFGLAAISGILSAWILTRQPEHPKAVEQESLAHMLWTPLKDANLRKLLLYTSWWMVAVGIASPFWQPFMIKKLGLSMVNIQVYGTISTAASLLALRPWGILIDRFGNKTAMRFAIVLGALNPMVWVFATPESHWFIYLEAATSGIMWSGAGIVATNFVLAVAPEGQRQVYSGMFGAFSGVAMMVTMLMSGAMLPPPIEILGFHLESEQVLFAITGLARWTAQIPLSWVHEPRALPVGAVVAYLRQYAKVRIAPIMRWSRGRSRRQMD